MKRYVKLYEHYPGADPVRVSIEKCMRRAEEVLDIPSHLSEEAIGLLLSYYAGEPISRRLRRGEPLLKAIDYWQECYVAMMEDGYGPRQIEEELEKLISPRD